MTSRPVRWPRSPPESREVAHYRLTSLAASDVQAVYVQSHDLFGAGQAETYHAGLHKTFQKLAVAPLQTRLRTEYEPPVHIFTFKAHVIVYETEVGGDIVILRVRHAHEDWSTSPL